MLMRRVVEEGKFRGYKFDKGEDQLTHLQYADNSLIVGDKKWLNIKIIKANLLLFEVMLGLKVNFHKSVLMGVNISQRWVEKVSKFLNCKIGCTLFKYLGLPIGANPRRLDTWKPVIEAVRSRLSKWKNNQLSIGGRVIIIKSVLSALPIYFLSFFKAPIGIISKLESLFKQFLWGGSEDVRKINWVKWVNVRRPLEEGGLGIRNLRILNLALLGKWGWKIRNERNDVWYKTLVNRYGLSGEHINTWCKRLPC
jgi:hypothetical protein